MGLFDSIVDLAADVAGAPFRVLNIPPKILAEIAAKVDPDDDVAIRELAEQLAKPLGATAEAVEQGIREAFK